MQGTRIYVHRAHQYWTKLSLYFPRYRQKFDDGQKVVGGVTPWLLENGDCVTVREEYGEGMDMNGVYMGLDGHPDLSGQLLSKNGKGYSDFCNESSRGKGIIACLS